jgi:NAD(P)H-hydrate epimerase
MLVLTAEQMRAADRHAIETLGIPSLVLMECAGVEVVRAMEDALEGLVDRRVLVLCGTGNNGGDGLVVARRLHGRGAFVQALLVGDESRLSEDGAAQWRIARALGVPSETCGEDEWETWAAELAQRGWDVVVDALLGTGTRGALRGLLAQVAMDLNASDVPVVAVDVPTGLSGDSVRLAGPAVEASLTVALAAPKLCHVFAPAVTHCGDVAVVDIGIPDESLETSGAAIELIEDELVAEIVEELADRPEDSHKGTWGHVVVVAGQAASPGAAALAGRGALTAGAGLVTVAAPAPCTAAVAAQAAELMHLPLPADAAGAIGDAAERVDAILERASTLAVGPGLGQGRGAAELLEALLERAHVPVVLDADALNLVAAAGRLPDPRDERPLVLTPHPGELARLARGLGLGEADLETADERLPVVAELSRRHSCVVVLKGFRTVVALPDGELLVNPTGGPGLGTAGAGDVLTGFLAGLIAQGAGVETSAAAAVHLHGRAADLAETELGQMALTASALLDWWPRAVASVLPDE